MLVRWRLPGDDPDAIEPQQAEFGTEPEITVGRLDDRPDPAFEKAIADLPRRVRVLTDVQFRVQGERARAQHQHCPHQHYLHRDNALCSCAAHLPPISSCFPTGKRTPESSAGQAYYRIVALDTTLLRLYTALLRVDGILELEVRPPSLGDVMHRAPSLVALELHSLATAALGAQSTNASVAGRVTGFFCTCSKLQPKCHLNRTRPSNLIERVESAISATRP